MQGALSGQPGLMRADERSAAASWPAKLRRLSRRSRAGTVGALILLVLVLVAIGAPWFAPQGPTVQNTDDKLLPPAWLAGRAAGYPLGTDNLGRDVLSRIVHGSRISLSVGVVAVVISIGLGVPLGLLAGYRGGRWDTTIMALAEVQLAFPFVILAIAIIVAVGPSLLNTVLILGVTNWVWYGGIIRGQVLTLREREFVQAARAVGCGDNRIIWHHLLPLVATPVIVIATLQLARMVLLEATLSFLGLGVQPPTPTWGSMLADGRAVLYSAWWVATFPGLAITVAVLGINLLGDGLRDILDPRLKT